MKKAFSFVLIFLNLSFLCADSYITINNHKLSLDTSIKEIQDLFGTQKELDIIPFEPNSDWDTLCYKFDGFTVYSSRVTKMPYKIEIFAENQSLNIDGKLIVPGTAKDELKFLIEKTSFEGTDKNHNSIYVFYLLDYQEAGFIFDENNILKQAYLSYTPMD